MTAELHKVRATALQETFGVVWVGMGLAQRNQ
jgi:hypothetical protein